MKTWFFRFAHIGFAVLACLTTDIVKAEIIVGGDAMISLTTSPTNGAFADRFFVGNDAATLSRAAILNTTTSPAVPFARDPGGVTMSINGASLVQPTGRGRQTSTLDFTPSGSNIVTFLSSWSAGTPGNGAFGPNLVGGERLGIDGVLRFDTPLGVAVLGDFALQYNPASGFGEGLTLTQNLDANAITWLLDIEDATFNSTANGFSFSASMFTTPGPAGFVGLDANGGRFTINAITAVPEPSSILLLGAAAAGLCLRRGKTRVVRQELLEV